jgi:hypothetical protein
MAEFQAQDSWSFTASQGPIESCEAQNSWVFIFSQGILGGAGKDATAPVVSGISPTAGSQLGPYDSITCQVTDLAPGLGLLEIQIDQAQIREVAYTDLEGFLYPYTGAKTAITNGFSFTLTRGGGWISAPTIRVRALDQDANEA